MFRYVRWMALLSGLTAAPVLGATALQCVPYARIVSGVEIYGDALTWWDQAQDHYKRGSIPKKGAVLAFRPVGPMTLGHVAVVSRILDDRRVLIRHANWSSPGAIEEDVLAIDVSDAGDWSQVRVWHSPTGQMGARTNPTFGFIYPAKAKLHPFTPDPALGSSLRYASMSSAKWDDEGAEDIAPVSPPVSRPATRMTSVQTHAMVAAVSPKPAAPRRKAAPRIEADPFVIEYADNSPSDRSLGDVIADVKRESLMN
ncbi:CHAP domain-containing protein [Sphingobium sp. WTD-1]|uniref:CHAP domain-containing protein n=1 Tax=Sphingobium sp. WTD-1 TaxID=2979467 RepID=UPI0024DEA605|nr:CHAP domain-containing protein [Sphingobium sp. WTD-1]WIA56438.1 CHAP domain-containing protein [Sphingobium sp. WTD-1]